MAVPPKTDPCWKRLLTEDSLPEFKSLATKLTVARLRRAAKQKPATLPALMSEICDFFLANPFAARDIAQI